MSTEKPVTHWRRHDDDRMIETLRDVFWCATACGRLARVEESTSNPRDSDCPECEIVWRVVEFDGPDM